MWLFRWRDSGTAVVAEDCSSWVLRIAFGAGDGWLRRVSPKVFPRLLDGCMGFFGCKSKRSFKFYPYTVKSICQLVGRINHFGGFTFQGFSATFRTEICVISDFFAALSTIRQTFSPLISMLDSKFKPLSKQNTCLCSEWKINLNSDSGLYYEQDKVGFKWLKARNPMRYFSEISKLMTKFSGD